MAKTNSCLLPVLLVAALWTSGPPAAEPAKDRELWVGTAVADITPDKPVALDGHRNLRISTKVASPITAAALALESRQGDQTIDQAVIVSCDLVAIRPGVLEKVRQKVKSRARDLAIEKIFLCATHTHNAPVTLEGRYALPEQGVMRPAEYVEFMTGRVAEAISESWGKRRRGKAVVAQNRRALYADGSAQMYGPTNVDTFRGIEGYEDHNLDVLFFWDEQEHLIATAINVPCPAQEAEGGQLLHADFWHPVRQVLRQRHGSRLVVLGWTGAGGDQSPRPLYGKAADERMRKLRGVTRLEEIARRIVNAWEDAYDAARKDLRQNVVLQHRVEQIPLPYRKVTEAEVAEARKEAAKYASDPAQRWNYRWHQGVVERYEAQKSGTEGMCPMELHVLRLGDVAIATNEFELYTDYGVQIKARSPAVQTFVIQLTGSAGYLPTERAVRAGGYGAVIQSSRVGPEGGQILVDRTVELIRSMWPK
jgi:hypothetical protein